MKTKLTIVAAAAALTLSGCVSPDVVTKTQVGDSKLTCGEIETQLVQLEEIRAEAKKGKTVSGANVAAALLFWPAIIGNHANATEALAAANERHEVLVALANKKRCKF
ncbi:hypothetical protein [Phaeobacter italicus]|jgi:outer membrane lipoprotein SlyB|uniref:Lipoprotein n=1 Tax=Phaeobacter italicus TaxID=481446 RepID=A0A0H5D7H3_9RHOB|nr:hypothetical protein [Phaeobacter italicus]EEB72629.1 conserved hypothetical protein [Ruegeria sp. R11]MEC8016346.1 hypothetical protein [Pseudomonadota bacterium]NKX71839.1 hypothetical protein [Rhodobacteraceae bacterium R_SAG1]MBO9442725.1 hypothetical protein [Phaeobacter italicus]MBY5977065.1 YgdI/YgdR family lipoprotein [Phaeobacter italicus]